MRLFVISDEQLLEFYDCVMDGDLKRFESVMYKVKTDQEIKVDRPERLDIKIAYEIEPKRPEPEA